AELPHTVLTLDMIPCGIWRRNERPDKRAQHEEWVTSGRRPELASAKWVAVDFVGTVACTRDAPPDAGSGTESLDSPVPHGIGSNRAARSAAILRPLQSARAFSDVVP